MTPTRPHLDSMIQTGSFRLPGSFCNDIQGLLDKYNVPGISMSVVRKQGESWEEGVTTMGIRDALGSPWIPDVSLSSSSNSQLI
jgi:hypothetical protein